VLDILILGIFPKISKYLRTLQRQKVKKMALNAKYLLVLRSDTLAKGVPGVLPP
jgi:hypothetical protein